MQEKTDKELYKEFLLGNNESFEEIVIRHKNSIIYFIQRYTKSIDIAEDLAQDVFLYVLIHKKNYRFEYSLKTYLYTIAKSKALNYIKREKRIVAIRFAEEGIPLVMIDSVPSMQPKDDIDKIRKAVNTDSEQEMRIGDVRRFRPGRSGVGGD